MRIESLKEMTIKDMIGEFSSEKTEINTDLGLKLKRSKKDGLEFIEVSLINKLDLLDARQAKIDIDWTKEDSFFVLMNLAERRTHKYDCLMTVKESFNLYRALDLSARVIKQTGLKISIKIENNNSLLNHVSSLFFIVETKHQEI